MIRQLLFGAASIALVACGTPSVTPGDASPTGDAPSDSGGPTIVTTNNGDVVSSLTFTDTTIGHTRFAVLSITNSGTGATGPLAISFAGPAANDFGLDDQMTTCAGATLAPNTSCIAAVQFHPTETGDRAAVLSIISDPGGTTTIALNGLGLITSLRFIPPILDFGVVIDSASESIELNNNGPNASPIDSITVSGSAFTFGSTTCGATLAPGGYCDIVVDFTPTMNVENGLITVLSNDDSISAALEGSNARQITVTKTGNGMGTVTSSPSGIDCGTTCSAFFTTDVVLTAAPGTGSVLTGWSIASCGQSLTCTVPFNYISASVEASFSPAGTADLDVVFGGDTGGEVQIRLSSGGGPIATCFSNCTVPLTTATDYVILADTPANYLGISGVCTAAATVGDCVFTAVSGTQAATATFMKDTDERWTRLFVADSLAAAAFDGSGNLIVGSQAHIIKLAPNGAIQWSVAMPATALTTGPADSIYAVSGNNVVRLGSDGGTMWTRPLGTTTTACFRAPYPKEVAVGVDGSVVVHANDGGTGSITKWGPTGTQLWSQPAADNLGCSVAVDSQGLVYYDAATAGESMEGHRFAADGTPLSSLGIIEPEYHGNVSIDAMDALYSCASGHGLFTAKKLPLGGTTQSIGGSLTTSASWVNNGIAAAGNGEFAFVYATTDQRDDDFVGYHDLHLLHTGHRIPYDVAGAFWFGIVPIDVAVDATGNTAIIGYYIGIGGTETNIIMTFNP